MEGLAATVAIARLAEHLRDYLPGSSAWSGVYTFEHAARDAGVSEFWHGGSKLPALTELLEQTYRRRRDRFCDLIIAIVQNGIKYRAKKGEAVTRGDLDQLNELIEAVHFKIPELRDRAFRDSLPGPKVPQPTSAEPAAPDDSAARRARKLETLQQRFLDLQRMSDRQRAGLDLEKLLTELFEEFGLDPREGFRVTGEQIDGSFLLHQQVYLVEVKWTSPVTLAALLAFGGKIAGKATFTRGLFISVNGYTAEARDAITRGKTPSFAMMDGAHLYRVLSGGVALDAMLTHMIRLMAEEGTPYIPATRLFGA